MPPIAHKKLMGENGILVGCDRGQEWLLSWWWDKYRAHNRFPVAFLDFGMGGEARNWCASRGQLIDASLDELKVASMNEVRAEVRQCWESVRELWEGANRELKDLRAAWFKKPLALLKSPFERSVWLDLDCEILGPIDPMFSFLDAKSKMGLCLEVDSARIGEHSLYNGGVIVFEKGSPLLKEWADAALSLNDHFLTDQDALSYTIFNRGFQVYDIPDIYNWRMRRGVHLGAVVIHWVGGWGKAFIRQYGGFGSSWPIFPPKM